MRNHLLKLSALCAVLLAVGCQSTGTMTPQQDEAPPPKNPEFATEMAKFEAQFPNAMASKYEEDSIRHNNEKKFDEKGNCHGMSKYPVVIILVLDASGKVTRSMTDVSNAKAECFRKAYTGVQFPKPPMASYRKAINLK